MNTAMTSGYSSVSKNKCMIKHTNTQMYTKNIHYKQTLDIISFFVMDV